MIRPLTEKCRVRTSFDVQEVKGSQTLLISSWEHFYHIFPSLWGVMSWKKSPWLKFEILGVFANTWTANYKYSVPDCGNLSFPIQMIWSSKQKTFSAIFIPFMESPSNFKHFQKKKKDCVSQCVPEINDRLGLVKTTH